MLKKIIGLILSIILFSNILPIFADEGYFENDYGKQVSQSPTVCLFQPDDHRINESTWKIWYTDAKRGIDTWRSVLEQSGSGEWKIDVIEIPLNKLELLNRNACDITVEFVDRPYIQDGKYANALGWWDVGTGTTKIVYSSFQYCGKEYDAEFNIFVNTICFGDKFERSRYMASVVQHEFGHALGLGHYIGYDSSFMQNWYDTGKGFPSIMTPMPPNEDMKTITQEDVQRIRQIYGDKGFGKKTNNISVFNEPIIEPKHEPEVSNIQTIQVKKYQTSSVKISGYVPEKLYTRGTPIEFKVTKPDGTTETFATMVSNRQYFEYPMIFDSKSQTGRYEILAIFKGEFIQKNAINVSTSSSTTLSNNVFPQASSNSGKYLEKINVDSTNNQYTVKAYFGKTSPPNSSIRITAENECGMKKQVFQQDFLFRAENEISFSFYQTSQGKPSQCAIYFSITDFNGKKLDSIKTSYELQPTNKQNPSTNQIIKPVTKQTSSPIFTDYQKRILSVKIDSVSISLIKLKERMDISWNRIMDAQKNYKSTQSQEHIDKALDVYNGLYSKQNNLVENLDEVVADFFRLENSVSSYRTSHYEDYFKKLNNMNSQITKIESDTKYISQELDYAKKTEDERKSTSKSGSQCFLFWC